MLVCGETRHLLLHIVVEVVLSLHILYCCTIYIVVEVVSSLRTQYSNNMWSRRITNCKIYCDTHSNSRFNTHCNTHCNTHPLCIRSARNPPQHMLRPSHTRNPKLLKKRIYGDFSIQLILRINNLVVQIHSLRRSPKIWWCRFVARWNPP